MQVGEGHGEHSYRPPTAAVALVRQVRRQIQQQFASLNVVTVDTDHAATAAAATLSTASACGCLRQQQLAVQQVHVVA